MGTLSILENLLSPLHQCGEWLSEGCLLHQAKPNDDGRGKGSSRERRPLTALSPAPSRRCASLDSRDARLGRCPPDLAGREPLLMKARTEAVAASIAPARRHCVHATRHGDGR